MTRAIELDPKCTNAYLDRAGLYIIVGKPAEAVQDCNRAIGIEPKRAGAFIARAKVHRALGEYDKAIADCDAAIELGSTNAETYCECE